MPKNDYLGATGLKTLAFVVHSITDAATEVIDLDAAGANNALYLPGCSDFEHGDRIAIVFTSTRTAGNTNIITFVVEDADGTVTTIGTPAAASVDGDSLIAGVADACVVAGVRLKPNRPWLKLSVTSSSATDTVVCTALVLAVPASI